MFIEVGFGLFTASMVTLNATHDWRKKQREIKEIKNRFHELMQELNLCTKGSKYTFDIYNVKEIENGFQLKINIPPGLKFEDLETHKKTIATAFKSIISMEDVRFKNILNMNVITKDIGKFEFKPIKTYPHQLYIGKTFDNKDYIIDITKACHILVGGTTGTGKTFLLSCILTNLIYNSSNSIEIHLSQIMKGEIGLFENCKPVKFVGKNLKEVAYDLIKVGALVDSRSKKFTELGVKNLQHYNKHYPKSKMKRIYYIIEEISFFMPQDADDDITKELKSQCWSNILTIVKAGRSSGIHFLSVTQRSTTTNLPSDVKSQLCRITMQQISAIDSRNIIECDDACKLQERECLCYGTADTMQIIKTHWVDEDFEILNKYVPEIKIPNIKNKQSNMLNKPILVNDGIAKELPLYIKPVKKEIEIIEQIKIKPKKKMKKGMILED